MFCVQSYQNSLFLLSLPQITYFVGNYTSYKIGEVRNLRRENQKLKQELKGVHNEVEKLKKLISQQSLKSGALVIQQLASLVSGMRKQLTNCKVIASTAALQCYLNYNSSIWRVLTSQIITKSTYKANYLNLLQNPSWRPTKSVIDPAGIDKHAQLTRLLF